MKNAKLMSTFMKAEAQLNLDIVSKFLNNKEKEQYQQEVKFLIYLMLETRPDIAFAVTILSRFTVYFQIKHVKALNHIFCYLNETIHIDITYSQFKSSISFDYSNSDYAETVVKEGCKSISRYIFFLAGGPVLWSCKCQSVITTSSTEAKYIAQYNVARKAIWIQTFLQELEYRFSNLTDQSTVIYANNNGA